MAEGGGQGAIKDGSGLSARERLKQAYRLERGTRGTHVGGVSDQKSQDEAVAGSFRVVGSREEPQAGQASGATGTGSTAEQVPLEEFLRDYVVPGSKRDGARESGQSQFSRHEESGTRGDTGQSNNKDTGPGTPPPPNNDSAPKADHAKDAGGVGDGGAKDVPPSPDTAPGNGSFGEIQDKIAARLKAVRGDLSADSQMRQLMEQREAIWDKKRQTPEHIGWKKYVADQVVDSAIRDDQAVLDQRFAGNIGEVRLDPMQKVLDKLNRVAPDKMDTRSMDEDDRIKYEWYKGVRREYQAAADEAELRLYENAHLLSNYELTPAMAGDVQFAQRVTELKARLGRLTREKQYLNWGEVTDESQIRMGELVRRYTDYLKTDGVNTDLIKRGLEPPTDPLTEALAGASFADFANRIYYAGLGHVDWDNKKPSWAKSWEELGGEGLNFTYQVQTAEQLANAAARKRYIGHVDLKGTMENQEMISGLGNDTLDYLYTESAGGREMMEDFMGHYFVEKNGRLFFKDKAAAQEWSNQSRFNQYKQTLVNKWKNRPDMLAEAEKFGVDAVSLTKMRTGLISAAFLVSNIAESADQYRWMTPGAPTFSEQLRAQFHPLAKLKDKARGLNPDEFGNFKEYEEAVKGMEDWGGSIGQYVVEQPSARQALIDGTIVPMPEVVYVSLFEVVGEDKQPNVALKLLSKQDIDFNGVAQNLWGSYQDKWNSANAVYEYSAGKRPAGSKEEDWLKWGDDLRNAYAKLRDTVGARYFETPEALLWMVANSVGIDFKKPLLQPKEEHLSHAYSMLSNMLSGRLSYLLTPEGKFYQDLQIVDKASDFLHINQAQTTRFDRDWESNMQYIRTRQGPVTRAMDWVRRKLSLGRNEF